MTVTKARLAEALFDEVGFNKREAKELIDQFFEEIRSSLESGEAVKISGFGSFCCVTRGHDRDVIQKLERKCRFLPDVW